MLLRLSLLVVTMHCVPGVESLLLGPPYPGGTRPPGLNAAHRLPPAPSWQRQGLPEAAGAALHGQHRRRPRFPGRVYSRHQTARRTHGSQPAGTCHKTKLKVIQCHRRVKPPPLPPPGSAFGRLLHPDELGRASAAGLPAAAQAHHVQPARLQQPLRGGVPLQREGDGPGADGRLALTYTHTHTQPDQEWDRAQPAAM